jgi:cytochrome c
MAEFGTRMNRRLERSCAIEFTTALALLVMFALTNGTAYADGPNLGRTATPEEIDQTDRSIPPDGRGLPPGRGTALEGKLIYLAKCARCHGADGQGGPADKLVGGGGSLTSPHPIKTVGSYWPYATTLFDYIRRAMPYDRPASLGDDEVYAVSAYVLKLNGIVSEDLELNRKSLPRVEMPNRDGFVISPSPR